jgi:hypothetical protein
LNALLRLALLVLNAESMIYQSVSPIIILFPRTTYRRF